MSFITNATSASPHPLKMSLNDVCVFIPAWFGSLASVSLGLIFYLWHLHDFDAQDCLREKSLVPGGLVELPPRLHMILYLFFLLVSTSSGGYIHLTLYWLSFRLWLLFPPISCALWVVVTTTRFWNSLEHLIYFLRYAQILFSCIVMTWHYCCCRYLFNFYDYYY